MDDLPFTTIIYLTWGHFWWLYLSLFMATYFSSKLYFRKLKELERVPSFYTFLYFTLYYIFILSLIVVPIFIDYLIPSEQIESNY